MAELSPTYRERSVQFGSGADLFGIVTLPTSAFQPTSPVVIIPNSGVIHRVGANRIHVYLARALAKSGFRVLRFDLSGIGDSGRRSGNITLADAVEQDLTDALTFLQSQYQADSFVAIGLCSGAHDSLRLALRDSRVVGVVSIDVPGSFRNMRHVATHYGQRVLALPSWRNALQHPRRALKWLLSRLRPRRAAGKVMGVGVRPILPRDTLGNMLRTMNDRNVKSLFLFTAGLEENYNYEHQFRDNFPEQSRSENTSYRFFAESDHTFSERAERDALIEAITTWLRDTTFEQVAAIESHSRDLDESLRS